MASVVDYDGLEKVYKRCRSIPYPKNSPSSALPYSTASTLTTSSLLHALVTQLAKKITQAHPNFHQDIHPIHSNMKVTSIYTTSLTALAAFTTTTLANSCILQNNGIYTYIVDADTMPDISGVCGGLWDNLKRFSQCSASATSCGAVGTDNNLHWQFNVPSICNGGMVESAWWEATKNQWGSIDCP